MPAVNASGEISSLNGEARYEGIVNGRRGGGGRISTTISCSRESSSRHDRMTVTRCTVLFCVALATVTASVPLAGRAQVAAVAAVTPPALRLPDGARPLRYAVTLTIVPGAQKARGEIAVDLELDRPHRLLWLNAEAIDVVHASSDVDGTRVQVIGGHDQFVALRFDPALPSGAHRITLTYDAEQSLNSTRGIFALQDAGAWYAMTHFEPTSARRAFPCFDEPGFKVPWQLTLRVPRELVALSNTPVASESDVEGAMKLVRFETTRPVPSYLVAFAVGPWETVDLGRVGLRPTPMRIVVPRGRTADAAFAARAYPELFDELERWFGSAHPYPKLDHIAIPLTVGFAMENVGLITYGAPTLLAKPGAAGARFRRGAANIGAHEISHQWFGNLVTTAWWDDIWLNEAFATWIAEKIVDKWQPDYERGAARIEERAEAMAEDALASARRIREPILERGDIRNAFDAITYQKGATVIGMFEAWIGNDAFRRGVREYLDARRDGSATVHDFLGALSAASGRPVGPAFSTFLDQNGVPQVAVALACPRGGEPRLTLTQRRHVPVGAGDAPAQQWQIPMCIRYAAAGAPKRLCTLLGDATSEISLRDACPRFVFANAGGGGYYLPAYRGDLLPRLLAARTALTGAELASVVYDLRELFRAGAVDGGEAMKWARVAAASKDRHVVTAGIELTRFIRDTVASDADPVRFAAFVRDVFGTRARRLGFAARPGESDDDALLRRSLLRLAAPEEPRLVAEARRLAVEWLGDRSAIDPGLVDVVLVTAAHRGDVALFDAFLAEARATQDRLDRRNLIVALLSFSEPALAQRGFALLLDPTFDIRELTTALRYSHEINPPRRAEHDFIAANFDAFAARVARDAPGGWPHYASRLCSEKDRVDVAAFWRDRVAKYPGAARNLEQASESISLCARLRDVQQPSVAAFLRTAARKRSP